MTSEAPARRVTMHGEERSVELGQFDALQGRRLDVAEVAQGLIADGRLVLTPQSVLIAEVC